jgi:cell division protein FtsI (penicillin-binding protein 3)
MIDPELGAEPPRDGLDVELTIEPVAQALVESYLDAAVAEFEPDWAQVIVLEPQSGDVVALGQRPAPRSPQPASPKTLPLHECMPLERTYPPGSSFKPLMLGLVFDRGLATPDTVVDCDHGACSFGRRVIHDVHPKGDLTAAEILVESSNIGMAKLVLKLVPDDAKKGDPAFGVVLDHFKGLGLSATRYGFPGETGALVPRLRSMSRNFSLASLSFGQEISVTLVQMASATAALANGGTWRPVRFVRSPAVDPGRRVFSPRTAAELRGMLQRVVEEGGAKRWKPAGWSVGGKTGTAEDERNQKKPVSSYWCFGPVHDPRFLVLAVLYHPKHGRFAADNAAKVAAPLLGELLGRFEVPRDRPEELTGAEARMLVSRAVGEGG